MMTCTSNSFPIIGFSSHAPLGCQDEKQSTEAILVAIVCSNLVTSVVAHWIFFLRRTQTHIHTRRDAHTQTHTHTHTHTHIQTHTYRHTHHTHTPRPQKPGHILTTPDAMHSGRVADRGVWRRGTLYANVGLLYLHSRTGAPQAIKRINVCSLLLSLIDSLSVRPIDFADDSLETRSSFKEAI